MAKKKKQSLQSKKRFYISIARELHYNHEFIMRIEECKSETEIMRVLENARINSINKDFEKLTASRETAKWSF